GHRFLAPGVIQVRHFADYAAKLERAKVVLVPARRREIILTDAKHLAFAQGFELVEDEALLDEVTGLVEWPVVLMGAFDEEFLRLAPAVTRTTIRVNQKCFVGRVAHAALRGEPRPAEGRPGFQPPPAREAKAKASPLSPPPGRPLQADLPPAGAGEESGTPGG